MPPIFPSPSLQADLFLLSCNRANAGTNTAELFAITLFLNFSRHANSQFALLR